MKARIFVLALVCAANMLPLLAQSSDAVLRDKITQAVMNVYNEQLAKEPGDYNTLFARAHQYYYNGEYDNALADVNQALMLTPDNDTELRFDELILRARVFDAKGDYRSELTDLYMAQSLNSESLACTDLIAKANLKVGDVVQAENSFKTILNNEPMNYDAMYGLAQVELARHNDDAALNYVNQAVDLFKAEPQVYINRANILQRLGEPEAASVDLIQGMCVGNDNGKSLDALFKLSDTNYDAVMNALNDINDRVNNNGMFRYVRANIAIDHQHYGQALKELNILDKSKLYESPNIYYNRAQCLMELGRYEDALQDINQIIGSDVNLPECYVVKSICELNSGVEKHYDTALSTLNQYVGSSATIAYTKAQLYAAQGHDREALVALNDALAVDPTDTEALLLRGSIYKSIDNQDAARKDFESILALNGNDCYSLKGFALHELGRDTEARNWAEIVTSTAMPGGENCLLAAMLMSKIGDNKKGVSYLKKALENGYGSLHELSVNQLPYLNLQSLRSEANMESLIKEYNTNFAERF